MWLLVLGVLVSGFCLWQLSGSGPQYRPLNSAVWRGADVATAPDANPRRDMAFAAQDWLEARHPARLQVYTLLGPADAFPAAMTEAYRVGCGFTAPGCETEDWLLVRYGGDGRVVATTFQPAAYLPAAGSD